MGFMRLNSTSHTKSNIITCTRHLSAMWFTQPDLPPNQTHTHRIKTPTVLHLNTKRALSSQDSSESLNIFRVLLRKPLCLFLQQAAAIQLLFLMRTSDMQSHPSSEAAKSPAVKKEEEKGEIHWLQFSSEAIQVKKKKWRRGLLIRGCSETAALTGKT